MIHREWVERARQQQIENYVATARQEIAARRFTAALEILHQAQTLDPDAPQVQALVDSALSGQTQERRRREIEEISRRIEEALNQDDHESACREASEGLGRFPGDRTLLRLLGIAEKQRQVAERKKFVDDQLANARKLMQEKRYEELQQSQDWNRCWGWCRKISSKSARSSTRPNASKESTSFCRIRNTKKPQPCWKIWPKSARTT
jgi:hypothetical protein